MKLLLFYSLNINNLKNAVNKLLRFIEIVTVQRKPDIHSITFFILVVRKFVCCYHCINKILASQVIIFFTSYISKYLVWIRKNTLNSTVNYIIALHIQYYYYCMEPTWSLLYWLRCYDIMSNSVVLWN